MDFSLQIEKVLFYNFCSLSSIKKLLLFQILTSFCKKNQLKGHNSVTNYMIDMEVLPIDRKCHAVQLLFFEWYRKTFNFRDIP